MHSSIVSLPLPSGPRHASLTGRAATFIVCRPARGSPGPSRAQRLLPGPGHLRHYQRSWLRGDVIAGVTVAAYLVPQVMAYAEVAGPAGAIRYLRRPFQTVKGQTSFSRSGVEAKSPRAEHGRT